MSFGALLWPPWGLGQRCAEGYPLSTVGGVWRGASHKKCKLHTENVKI